jgi:SAM-dependent methyltransferase
MMLTVETARIQLLDCRPPFKRSQLTDLELRGLHCGCGINVQKGGWLNTDHLAVIDGGGNKTQADRIAQVTIGDRPIYYLEHDVAHEFPFENGSFDWIYSEHFIEHITPTEAVLWLKECRRLIGPGGVVRISTPNLRTYAEAYVDVAKGDTFFADHHKRLMSAWNRASSSLPQAGVVDGDLRDWLLVSNPSLSQTDLDRLMEDPASRERLFNDMASKPARPALLINQIFQMWGHKWIYDIDEMRFVAQEAGFSSDSINETSFQQGEIGEVCLLDMPWHNDESLYVELKKPIES